jgi:hypothetical protein
MTSNSAFATPTPNPLEALSGFDVRPSTATISDPKIVAKTSRHVISKLELPTADPRIQLDLVSSKVFELSPRITLESHFAEDNTKWHATDEIYDTAKGTYQSIIEPFTELPKVYKLESTKDKLYQYRLSNLNGNLKKKPLRSAMSSRYLERFNSRNQDSEYLEDQEDYKKNKKKTFAIESLTPEEREELELETIINPFDPPKPWVRKTRLDGEVVYVNEETKQVKTSAPGQVWAEKYKNLEKLVPRYVPLSPPSLSPVPCPRPSDSSFCPFVGKTIRVGNTMKMSQRNERDSES